MTDEDGALEGEERKAKSGNLMKIHSVNHYTSRILESYS